MIDRQQLAVFQNIKEIALRKEEKSKIRVMWSEEMNEYILEAELKMP